MCDDDRLKRALTKVIENDGLYLDHHKWDEWLALFAEDVVFWVPTWKNEKELTNDPNREVSLIYYESRTGLEERVWRTRSGDSISSVPLVRTVHGASHVRSEQTTATSAAASANWWVHVFDTRTRYQHIFFGFYEYEFRLAEEGWLITRKKVVLANDHIPTFVDFYTL